MVQNYFKVLIVGAGNIGAFYDSPLSNCILTHAHAVINSDEFELIGFYDNDIIKAKHAADRWNTNYYNSIDEAFSKHRVDIVVIAVPDQYHFEIMKNLQKKDIKLILLEKPIASTLEEASHILDLYKNNTIKVLVNYSRRFIPKFQEISNAVNHLKWGRFLAGTVYYGKGLLHNGSHAVDLLRMVVGEFDEPFSYGEIEDYSSEDKSIYAILHHTDGGVVNLCPIDFNKYDIFEIDMLFEEGRIRIINSGAEVEIYRLDKNLEYQGYVNLTLDEKNDVEINMALSNMYKNIYYSLIGSNILISDIFEAFKTFELCDRIKESRND